MNRITEITRRNIFDTITMERINWAGRLNEVQFLSRLFELKTLPSTDRRFGDAGQDIWQHRINNYDWEDDWVLYDPRFNLLFCEDGVFLRFLCETIHPVVRADVDEVKKLQELYNQLLRADGLELIEYTRISDIPVFKGKEANRSQELPNQIENLESAPLAAQDNSEKNKKRRLRVFICHASEDKQKARHLFRHLVDDGYDAWLDEENLFAGQDWKLEIGKAIRKSDVFAVLLSSKSVAKTGYVQKEIVHALDFAQEQPEGTIFITPIRLEEGLIPERLKHLQYVNLFDGLGYERLLRALGKRVKELST
jgi:hypothetical protein